MIISSGKHMTRKSMDHEHKSMLDKYFLLIKEKGH